jgi:hypothetical protein
MLFLANENFPGDAVSALRAAGHDCIWVRTVAPGARDPDVLAHAMRDNRILLTFDKDFGELAYRSGLPATCGVVLFRMPMPLPEAVGLALVKRLEERPDWQGHFSVIEPSRVRMRKLVSVKAP